jgi:hypothetical protein
MEHFFNWIKNHKKTVIVICLAVFVVPIVFIQFLYWLGQHFHLIHTKFSASDILTYWGVFIAAIGAISLGLLALWQNHTLSLQASIAQKRLEELELNKVKPKLNIHGRHIGYCGNFSNPIFALYNRGNGTAFDVIVRDLPNKNNSEYNHVTFAETRTEEITVGNKIQLEYDYNCKADEKRWHIGILVTYFDINDEHHQLEQEFLLSKDKNANLIVDKRISSET